MKQPFVHTPHTSIQNGKPHFFSSDFCIQNQNAPGPELFLFMDFRHADPWTHCVFSTFFAPSPFILVQPKQRSFFLKPESQTYTHYFNPV